MADRPMTPVPTAHRRSEPTWKRPKGNGFPETAKALAIAVLLALPVAGVGGYVMYSDQMEAEKARLAQGEAELAHQKLIEAPPLPLLPVETVAKGRDLFAASCATCHNPQGTGVPGLGKNLTDSAFVASLDDSALLKFIETGRPTAKPLPMPPKGGNPDLTEKDLAAVVHFLRAIQDPRRKPELPAPIVLTAAAPTEAEKAQALAAAGGDEELAEYIASGAKIFAGSCVACHGKDARGLPGNGKDLVNSEFCKKSSDDDLLAFIKRGRDPSDPANTTGVGMPAKGGNPALSDDDILDVIAYVRSLQTASK